MNLLIDNYDSFSFNLYQLIGSIDPQIRVIRNDEVKVEDILREHFSSIIISPGPGAPKDAGMCEELIQKLDDKTPILGVCLGHQAICEAFGAKIVHAKKLMHGKQSHIELDLSCPLFKDLPKKIDVARYHSLAVEDKCFSSTLKICARAEDGEIMAVMHKNLPMYGVQFHPESIMTPDGYTILNNFINIAHKGANHD